MDNDKYLEDVLVFVDHRGTILEKHKAPTSTTLKMKYDKEGLFISMHTFAHGMGNGSCAATVIYQGQVVYKASGNFTTSTYNVEMETYHPGPWEQVMGLSV